jgi:hypothetical protein
MTSHQLARMLLQNADCDVTFYDGYDTVTARVIDFSAGTADLTPVEDQGCPLPITRQAFEEAAFRREAAKMRWATHELEKERQWQIGPAFITNIEAPKEEDSFRKVARASWGTYELNLDRPVMPGQYLITNIEVPKG